MNWPPIPSAPADPGSLAGDNRDHSTARSKYRESIKVFQELDHTRGIARLREYFACLAAAQLEAERPCDWRPRPLRYVKISRLRSRLPGQAKLETNLRAARQALSNKVGATAWLEGWALPAERAIEEVLMPEDRSLPS